MSSAAPSAAAAARSHRRGTRGWAEESLAAPRALTFGHLVPELAEIERRAIHESWKLDEEIRVGLDYPEPVVAL